MSLPRSRVVNLWPHDGGLANCEKFNLLIYFFFLHLNNIMHLLPVNEKKKKPLFNLLPLCDVTLGSDTCSTFTRERTPPLVPLISYISQACVRSLKKKKKITSFIQDLLECLWDKRL